MKNKRFKKSTSLFLVFALMLAFISAVPVFFVPVSASGDSFSAISSGGNHTAFIKADGSLWIWGWNEYGQVGDGTTFYKKDPAKIMDDVVQVSAGGWHTLAVKSDGSLWAWGGNNSGQLGNKTKISSLKPVKIMDDVIKISAGGSCSMAVKSDGSLWTWGYNKDGQLGDDTTIEKLYPVKVMDDVIQISAGEWHGAAIKSDNTLWTWGNNSIGQLGINNYIHKCKPVKIMENIIQVSAGGSHTVAIDSNGNIWAWGRNGDGQLGDDTYISKLYPIKVKNSGGIIQISAGYASTLAVKNDGTLLSWGYDGDGHSGYGRYTQRSLPIKITDEITLYPKSLTDSIYIYDGKTEKINAPLKFMDISTKPKEMQNAVNILASNGIIIGVSKDLFAPDRAVTKAEAAAFIVRMLDYFGKLETPAGSDTIDFDYFTDVRPYNWFHKEVYAAAENHLMSGISETKFEPNGKMSREGIFDLAADILTQYSDCELKDGERGLDYVSKFTDKHEFLTAAASEKYMDRLGLLVKEGLVLNRIDGRLALNETMTRGDFAVMLYRLFNKIK